MLKGVIVRHSFGHVGALIGFTENADQEEGANARIVARWMRKKILFIEILIGK